MMTKKDYYDQYDNHQNMRDNVKKDKNRLHYHLMPPTGWLNDPNGLCQKDGIYHIYFQYTPYDCNWGIKLWGHYTSTDMIHFKEEEPFLYPDQKEDRDGVYSGSAYVEDGKIYYFYTGNVKLNDRDDYDYINDGREQNTLSFTSEDGMEISRKKLILDNDDYPHNMSKHVRDPKIFKKGKYYYMVLGARTKDSQGCVLLYRSQDLQNFQYYNCITTPQPFGYMWECPDLLEIDGQLFLICCPQGVRQNGYDYANVYQMGYFQLEYDFEQNQYNLGEFKELDRGFDIYAPQSFIDEKGRHILYAWMGIPDASYHNDPTIQYGWQHALTIPRTLIQKDGKIIQQPLAEMKQLRKEKYEMDIDQWNETSYDDVCYEMDIEFKNQKDFQIQIRDDVFLNYKDHVLTLSLGTSGCGRDQRSVEIKEVRHLDIWSDTSALEIFVNGGQEVFTTRVYSETLSQHLYFHTSHQGKLSYYPLDSYQIEKNEK
ncbi:glycoside hydrolase family 32 protein [Thomasclavelia saccharogumia]|nr:glycoside hydrolase family 32 protein [Thomasclavelia saccharogumia]